MKSIVKIQLERARLIADCVQASLNRTDAEADALRGRSVEEQIACEEVRGVDRAKREAKEAELRAKKQKKIDDAITAFESLVGEKPLIREIYGNRLLLTCGDSFVKAKRESVIPAALKKLAHIVPVR